ncbi:MAG TPA: crossover junction endodeoxyribonuclease RuvC [Bryobacteraceae bacterium]|jgi:crossover junction endodeoxyribonuclease RuvC|nr:crossover junction endodeoxyribonuclease RuvC [Bryobacteraceae bacterium]
MRIVGIDCGTERTGFGIIETDGRSHRFIEAGVIRTRPGELLERRLLSIASELRQVFEQFSPQIVAVEEVFHAVNTKSALKLAHVRGVVMLVAAEAGLPVNEYSALEVKMSVVGYGRAEKEQVQMMVLSLLGINRQFASMDATDALAVAICHGTRWQFPAAAGGRA